MVRSRFACLALATAAAATSFAAHAVDLGRLGPTYPIAEPNLLEVIKASLQAKKDSGELDRIQREAMKRAREHILTPAPVPNLARVVMPRRFKFDPSVRMDEGVVDQNGKTVVPPGTVVNPLDVMSFNKVLVFFDGRDPAQVRLAKEITDRETLEVKPILVAGSPIAVMKDWDRPVFFDQGGLLTQRLGLRAVPAVVRQVGQVLVIDEVPAP